MIKKTLLSLLAVAMLVASAYAGGSGKVTLAWNASASTNVTSYTMYGVSGTNTVFTANNANATIKVTGITGLTCIVSNLNSGPYTFTVTANDNYGLESPNSNTAWTNVYPSAPAVLRITDSTPQ